MFINQLCNFPGQNYRFIYKIMQKSSDYNLRLNMAFGKQKTLQNLLDSAMINIIRQDSQINEALQEFPSSTLNIAVFGTQSSGKSTLLNHVFGTRFPVLDTTLTRERCTKGVWLHSIGNFNVIDTEGFDSAEREPEDKMFEKKVALFCLAISDVLVINMWMNEIGRYEASHSHILKAIIRASQKLIASQQRKIVFVVRDCTEDADRAILKQQLHTHMMGIVKSQTQKSTMRFSLQYFMMSHLFDQEKEFKKQAKQLLKILSVGRKSTLSNYAAEDRLVYIKKLWEKICSEESEINLRTVEDVLRNYALERIKRETVDHMHEWIDEVTDLSKLKTYSRMKEAVYKEVRQFFLASKPRHLRDSEVQTYIDDILGIIESKQNKSFMAVLLPQEQDRLISEEYEARLDSLQNTNAKQFRRQLQKRRKQIQQSYKLIVKGLREYAKMTRRFIQKIQAKNQKYDQYLEHINNIFIIELQTMLNEEIDKQSKMFQFDGEKLKKMILILEEKHQSDAQAYLHQIWQKVVNRTSNTTIIDRIKAEGQSFSTASMSFFLGNQTEAIISFYRKLQCKATKYLSDLLNFNTGEQQTTINLQRFQQIHRVTASMMDVKLSQQSKRFKITLIFIAIMMYLFFSEFKLILRVLGMNKKRLKRWVWLYVSIMLSIFGILAYRNREYFKKFIEDQK